MLKLLMAPFTKKTKKLLVTKIKIVTQSLAEPLCNSLVFEFELRLTYCGLVMPYGDTEPGQHWLRYWLVAWWHQAITCTNVELSSVKSCDNPLRAISQEIPEPSVTKIRLKIDCLNSHSNLAGVHELTSSAKPLLQCGELESLHHLPHCPSINCWALPNPLHHLSVIHLRCY